MLLIEIVVVMTLSLSLYMQYVFDLTIAILMSTVYLFKMNTDIIIIISYRRYLYIGWCFNACVYIYTFI